MLRRASSGEALRERVRSKKSDHPYLRIPCADKKKTNKNTCLGAKAPDVGRSDSISLWNRLTCPPLFVCFRLCSGFFPRRTNSRKGRNPETCRLKLAFLFTKKTVPPLKRSAASNKCRRSLSVQLKVCVKHEHATPCLSSIRQAQPCSKV